MFFFFFFFGFFMALGVVLGAIVCTFKDVRGCMFAGLLVKFLQYGTKDIS